MVKRFATPFSPLSAVSSFGSSCMNGTFPNSLMRQIVSGGGIASQRNSRSFSLKQNNAFAKAADTVPAAFVRSCSISISQSRFSSARAPWAVALFCDALNPIKQCAARPDP